MSQDKLTTSWYFSSPIYFLHKDEWVKDLTKITDEDLDIIERALKYAVVESSESRENETLPKIIHHRSMANN